MSSAVVFRCVLSARKVKNIPARRSICSTTAAEVTAIKIVSFSSMSVLAPGAQTQGNHPVTVWWLPFRLLPWWTHDRLGVRLRRPCGSVLSASSDNRGLCPPRFLPARGPSARHLSLRRGPARQLHESACGSLRRSSAHREFPAPLRCPVQPKTTASRRLHYQPSMPPSGMLTSPDVS